MPGLDFPQLASVVQRNCDISDACHAGDYGLCTFLLKMREFYRWEHELPFTLDLPKDDLGNWLSRREQLWDGIEAEGFAPLPLARGATAAFDTDTANRELLCDGYVYSAGYGRSGPPRASHTGRQRTLAGSRPQLARPARGGRARLPRRD